MAALAKRIGFRGLLCAAIAVVWALTDRASPAEPLRLVTENSPNGLYGSTGNDKAPGFSVEVLRQVFAAMGQEVSIEAFPVARSWMIVARGGARATEFSA